MKDDSKEEQQVPQQQQDPILKYTGNFGPWQMFVIYGLIVSPSVLLITWQVLVMAFHALPQGYICKPNVVAGDPTAYDGLTYAEWHELAAKMGAETPAPCNVMEFTPNVSLVIKATEMCNKWIFDKSMIPRTIFSSVSLTYLITMDINNPESTYSLT